jgi:hypothetical protein
MSVLMGRLEAGLRDVDELLAEELRNAHMSAQLRRLVLGVLGSVVVTLTVGAGPLDWRAVASVALGALWTQVRAAFPTIPWDLVQGELEARRPAPKAPASPPAAG